MADNITLEDETALLCSPVPKGLVVVVPKDTEMKDISQEKTEVPPNDETGRKKTGDDVRDKNHEERLAKRREERRERRKREEEEEKKKKKKKKRKRKELERKRKAEEEEEEEERKKKEERKRNVERTGIQF